MNNSRYSTSPVASSLSVFTEQNYTAVTITGMTRFTRTTNGKVIVQVPAQWIMTKDTNFCSSWCTDETVAELMKELFCNSREFQERVLEILANETSEHRTMKKTKKMHNQSNTNQTNQSNTYQTNQSNTYQTNQSNTNQTNQSNTNQTNQSNTNQTNQQTQLNELNKLNQLKQVSQLTVINALNQEENCDHLTRKKVENNHVTKVTNNNDDINIDSDNDVSSQFTHQSVRQSSHRIQLIPLIQTNESQRTSTANQIELLGSLSKIEKEMNTENHQNAQSGKLSTLNDSTNNSFKKRKSTVMTKSNESENMEINTSSRITMKENIFKKEKVECPECKKLVALKKNGRIHAHHCIFRN